jgi:transglutaminase-like putative cysteine protease
MLLQALPIMVVLFILFPRIPGPLWSLPSDAHSGRTGLSDEMRLGNITSLVESEEIAFRVQFAGAAPAAEQLYWRGPVLWHTDGREWTRLSDREADSSAGKTVDYTPLGSAVSYSVTLESHNRQWLFALDLPATLPELPGGVTLRPDFQLLSNKRIDERLRYQVTSHPRYNTGFIEPWEWHIALSLPATINPRARALVSQWRSRENTDRAIVEQALALFRDQAFWYTRQPPALVSEHPVDEFLFETQRGFCEHYAAAFTTLMRLAGIPARVVTGYQGGEFNPVGDFLVVRQSDAHAWSEVWLEEDGWVRVDPTAVIPADRIEAFPDLTRFSTTAATPFSDDQILWIARSWRQLKLGWDALNHSWNQWVLGFDNKRQAELLRRLGLGQLEWRGMVGLMAGLLGLLLLLISGWLLWRRPKTADPVLRIYQRFCNKLAGRGIKRAKSEGPLDFARRVTVLRPDLADEVDLITNYYQRLRYSSKPTVEWLPAMLSAVKKFRP